jgi:hypothetical protein
MTGLPHIAESVDGQVEVTSCALCGESRGMTLGTYEGSYQIRRCRACKLVYTASRPSSSFTETHFKDEYIVSDEGLEEDFGRRRGEALARVVRAIERRHTGGTWLDVGAAGGELLRRLDGDRWTRSALEPSSRAANRLRADGIEVVEDFYPSSQLDGRTFDVITMMDVIMLMPDPVEAVRTAAAQLRAGGTLAVEIPGYAYRLGLHVGPVPLIRSRRWTDLNASIHLFFFSDASLRRLLATAGLSVVDVVPLPPSRRRGALGTLQRGLASIERMPGIRSGRPSLAAKYLYLASA